MKFGVRECTNIVFRAKTDTMVGNTYFKKGQPVLYIDSAKTSTLEGAATTVYAQGGRGNARLIAWEGEKTLTFTVEDALLSPLGFSILSGAGLIDNEQGQIVHVHKIVQQIVEGGAGYSFTYYKKGTNGYTAITVPEGKTIKEVMEGYDSTAGDADYLSFAAVNSGNASADWSAFNKSIPLLTSVPAANEVTSNSPLFIKVKTASSGTAEYTVDLSDALEPDEKICPTAPIFIMETEEDGSLKGMIETTTPGLQAGYTGHDDQAITFSADADLAMKPVAVDFYVLRNLFGGESFELQIDAENFAGYFYVEADTLFRRQDNGVDMPAIITLPNVKIQSNFTFTMASSGDPSTFTFTMDAMPGYTYFDPTKKVLCVIQIIDASKKNKTFKTVMPHNGHGSTGSETFDSFTDYVANDEDSYVGS